MRRKLKKHLGRRLRFTATVERFGTKNHYIYDNVKTILLKNICLGKTQICEHLWFACGKWSQHLKEGDTFSFDARVGSYEKGYKGYRDDVYDRPIQTDYRLERPTKIEVEDPSCKID